MQLSLLVVLYPQLERRDYQLPVSCPLNASYDMYLKQEDHKMRQGRKNFKCGFCNETFRSERSLDIHFEKVHPHEHYPGTPDLCMAELCDVLQCDWFKYERKGNKRSSKKSQAQLCSPQKLHASQDHCRMLSEQCFPVHMNSEEKQLDLYQQFTDLFCGALTCDKDERVKKLRQLWNSRGGPSVPFRVLAFLLVFALAVFYVIVLVLWSQIKGQQGDMRSIRGKRGWFQKKKKKLY
eukprot:TRINITY_DN10768_c0_g1_i1.p1 TRINITY_DN10768_c0_g1~~TRINITY_DN10768_c0_g1_i1.p1  ORF type:complete len:236 (+),score=24.75 TRINITY_DN10768_c0_g1_i1:218-925(+)